MSDPTDPIPTAPDLDAALCAEQLRLFEGNLPSAVGGMLLMAGLFSTVLYPQVPLALLLPWLAAVLALQIVRVAIHRRHRLAPPADAEQARQRRRALRLCIAAGGAAWGLGALLMFGSVDLQSQYFITFVIAALAAGSLTLTSFDPVAARSCAAAALVPLVVAMVVSGRPALQAMGAMVLLFLAFIDVSARRSFRNVTDGVLRREAATRRADAMQRNEQRLLQLTEELAAKSEALEITLGSMDQGLLSLGSDGRLNFYNRRLVELTHLPPELLDTHPTMEQIADYQVRHGHFGQSLEQLDEVARPALRRWMGGERFEFPPCYHRRTADGRVLEVKTRYLAGGAMVRTFSDVTDQADARERLVESEREARKLALVAAHTDNGVVVADADGRIEWVNEAFTRQTGYSLAEAQGRTAADLLRGPGTDAAAAAAFDAAAQTERRATAELLNYRKDGRPYWAAVELHAIAGAGGQVERFVSTARDITERRQAEAALLTARNEAERANRAKSQFLSAMSHELRTPMNAILGFGQLLAADPAFAAGSRQQGYVREILRAGQHLLDLINDVLDLSRVETGHEALAIEPVALHPIVADCLRLLQPLAREREVRLAEPDRAGLNTHVHADRKRLTQVLLNLLSNAIKYNRHGGRVDVQVRADGEEVVLEVTDTGPGLTLDQQAQLFRAFERLGAQHTAVQGAGIGLVLSKRLVELMGGSIGVTSEVGQGTTFWVRLARAPESAVVPPTAAAVAAAVVDMAPAAEAGGAGAVCRLSSVLYVEDNPVNIVLVDAMLAQMPGVRMRSAPLPEVGLELARIDPPDLILLDIQLPGIDGYEVLRRLRADDTTRRIPVVAVSANAMAADLERGRAAGFDAYLTKPVDMQDLLATVGRFLPR